MERIKLTTNRRADLEDYAAGKRPPTAASFDWLRNNGLTARREGVRHLAMDVTPKGLEALRSPFVSAADAEAACKRWRTSRTSGPFIIGWVVLRCRGGGFAIRVAFEGGAKSLLLPEGIDPELVRAR